MAVLQVPIDVREVKVRKSEIARYLGYRGVTPDEAVESRIDACLAKLVAMSRVRDCYQVFDLTQNEDTLSFAGVLVTSKSLSRNLRACSRVILFAATIGPGVDALIRRSELTSMTDAAIYQAAGAALIEAVCDQLNLSLKELARSKGLFLRPRFSPGYGDVPLALQKDFFRILDPSKNCGISLSDSLLMSPSKSVTALIGVSEKDTPCILDGCESCENAATCAFRR